MNDHQDSAVYVSYAWEGESPKIVEALESACESRGIKLIRDRTRVRYGDSIRAYMEELSAGGCVIVVLSKEYVRSEYCMYELREIKENGRFVDRVCPVTVGKVRIDRPVQRARCIRYWEKKTEELRGEVNQIDATNTGSLANDLRYYEEICRDIDGLLRTLGDMNALSEKAHIDTDFAALLARVTKTLGRCLVPRGSAAAVVGTRSQPIPETEIVNKMRTEITELFALPSASPLVAAMGAVLDEAGVVKDSAGNDAPRLVEILLGLEGYDQIRVLGRGFERSLRESARLGAGKPFDKTVWEIAVKVLGWLLLLAVREDWAAEVAVLVTGGRGLELELPLRSEHGREIAFARARSVRADLSSGRQVAGPHKVVLEPGWDVDSIVADVKQLIWRGLLRRKKRLPDSFGPAEDEYLNAALAVRNEEGEPRFLPIPGDRDNDPITANPAVLPRLKEQLPALNLVIFRSGDAGRVLHTHVREPELEARLDWFLDLAPDEETETQSQNGR